MAQLVTLSMMQNTIRRMTARYTEQAMTTAQINTYINLAYTLRFPLEFKQMKLTKPFTFTTVPNVDCYPFIYENDPTNPQTGSQVLVMPGNIEITPPIFCQGYILNYSQNKEQFFARWPKLSINQLLGSGGNAADVPYTGTVPPFPFLRAELDIFGNVTIPAAIISFSNPNLGTPGTNFTYVLTDQPQPNSDIGNLIDQEGNEVGTINYVTGAYDFTVADHEVIPADCNLYVSVIPYQPARPIDILFYNQQIILRPVPQLVFQVEFQISQQPTQLIDQNAAPELDEWYLFICALAAELIYIDFPDPEGMQNLMPTLDEQRLIAQRRTLRQYGNQRVQTIFTQPRWGLNPSYFFGQEYSG
jgi:hypothetical protein